MLDNLNLVFYTLYTSLRYVDVYRFYPCSCLAFVIMYVYFGVGRQEETDLQHSGGKNCHLVRKKFFMLSDLDGYIICHCFCCFFSHKDLLLFLLFYPLISVSLNGACVYELTKLSKYFTVPCGKKIFQF